MSPLAEKLLSKFYKNDEHPYYKYEQLIAGCIDGCSVVLDAGCGRTAPVLRKFQAAGRRLIGVDLVDPRDVSSDIEYHCCDLKAVPVESGSVDLVISRSVFEHLTEPEKVYAEMSRILKPGGHLIFLTANLYDYGTIIARLVPNKLHGKIVKWVEGRSEEDTFPVAYKTNSEPAVNRLSLNSGFSVNNFIYLNQYPNYFLFNGVLFYIGYLYERLTTKYHFLRKLRGWILVDLVKK